MHRWKDPEQAQRQKERLKQKKKKAAAGGRQEPQEQQDNGMEQAGVDEQAPPSEHVKRMIRNENKRLYTPMAAT